MEKDLKGVANAAEDASNSRAFVVAARSGFAVSGLLHLLVGIIAIRLAFGESKDAEQSGAMAQLAAQPAGYVLVWVGAAACLALGLWQGSEVIFGYRHAPARKRLGKKLSAAGQGIVFLALAVAFASFALGNRRDSGESTSDATALVMSMPFGPAFLLFIGAGIVVAGVAFVARGFLKSFARQLNLPVSKTLRRGTVALGIVGYAAKGVALFLVGLLVIVATVQANPEESTGLDGALKALRAQPFGVYALAVIGIGLGCYGLYQVAKAWLAKMD